MLAAANVPLQAFNIALLLLGVAMGIVWLRHLIRSGTWRDPLAAAPARPAALDLAALGVVILVFFVLYYLLANLLLGPEPPKTPPAAGSARWHMQNVAQWFAQLGTAVLMIVLIRRARPHDAPRLRLGTGVWVAVVALLIALPMVTVQLQAGHAVWVWLYPNAPAPVHSTLEVLEKSAWGRWGQVQLLGGAALVAPLVEELFFRGILLGVIYNYTRRGWPAIIGSAVLFGCVHAQPQDILPLVTLGIVLGYVRVRYAAVWPGIVLHMLFNIRTLAFALLDPTMVQG